MNVEKKDNYSLNQLAGVLFAKDINAIVTEIISVFFAFFLPTESRNDQLVTGINYLTMFNMWFGQDVDQDGIITLVRKDELPIPDLIMGMSGDFTLMISNNHANPPMRFLGHPTYRTKFKGIDIPINGLLANELYKFVVLEDDDGLYFNVYNLTATGNIVVSEGSGMTITTEPIRITNNRFEVEFPVNGDISFNVCHVHDVVNGVRSRDFDTKDAMVNPNNRKQIIIIDRDDEINANGMYGVVSYTK